MGKSLSEKLISAREDRGWTLSEAAEKMPNTGYGTLQHLEGRSRKEGALRSPPTPGSIQTRTAADLIVAYWPAIKLKDIVPGLPIEVFKV
jgi:hypothetical protein